MPTPEKSPYLSVVVTAYRRKTFLRQAIQSLVDQTLDPRDFEVVVLKDFADPTLDAWIASLPIRIRVITEDIPGMGEMMARGIEMARGEVVCFLDDDDRYRPERLANLRELFFRYDPLVYVHNAYNPIDGDGKPAPRWLERRPQPTTDLMVDSLRGGEQYLPWIQRYGGHVNNSTMATRADLLRESLPWLRELTAGPDLFLFAAAALSGGILRFEPDRWTDYRVHASTSHAGIDTDGERADLNEVDRLCQTADLIHQMVAVWRPRRVLAQRFAEGFRLECYLTRFNLDPAARFSFRDWIRFPRTIRWRGEKYLLLPWVRSIYRFLLPQAATRSYRSRRTREIQARAA